MLEKNHYKCFLKDDAALPMMYIDDCIECTIQFLKADPTLLKRNVYNIAGISFTPKQLAEACMKLIPGATVSYEPDFRQKIAESWPQSIDDHECKLHWNWEYSVSVYELAKKIFDGIDPKYKEHLK